MKAPFVSALTLVLLMSVGCVSQKRVDDCDVLLRRAKEQVVELQARLESRQNEIDALRSRGPAPDPQTEAQLAEARQKIDELNAALANAEQRIRELAAQTGSALPAELDRALMALAESNPELMTYDAQRGMVKFSSDLTFALGKAEVNAAAQRSLGALAGILKSPAAADYEILIVGHTDNVPVTNPATLRDHKTNWHLSVHRAIAVKDVMVRDGISNVRMQVAGHGEHRPIVANSVNASGRAGGAQANRRVEIFLRKMAYQGSVGRADTSSRSSAPAVPVGGGDVTPVPVKGGSSGGGGGGGLPTK